MVDTTPCSLCLPSMRLIFLIQRFWSRSPRRAQIFLAKRIARRIVRQTMPHNALRLPSVPLRFCASGVLVPTLLLALYLSVAPQVHERIHPRANNTAHECVVTMFASGNCEHATAAPINSWLKPRPLPLSVGCCCSSDCRSSPRRWRCRSSSTPLLKTPDHWFVPAPAGSGARSLRRRSNEHRTQDCVWANCARVLIRSFDEQIYFGRAR